MNDIKYCFYIFVLLVGIFVGLIKIKTLNNSNKIFLLLLLSTIFAEVLGPIIAFYGVSNYIVYHIFTPIQFCLVFYAYYYDIKDKILLNLIPFFIVLGLVLSLWIQPLPAFNSYYMNIELLSFSILSIYFFKNLLEIQTHNELKDYPLFWISSGLIIFCISNIFILGTLNFVSDSDIKQNKILISILMNIRYFSNYIYYSSFIVAFLVKQNTISDQHGK
ncbi:hypothetical protein ABID42_002074 [Arcicella rosea]